MNKYLQATIAAAGIFAGVASTVVNAQAPATKSSPSSQRPTYCSMLDAAAAKQLTMLGDGHRQVPSGDPGTLKAQEEWLRLEGDIVRQSTGDPASVPPLPQLRLNPLT